MLKGEVLDRILEPDLDWALVIVEEKLRKAGLCARDRRCFVWLGNQRSGWLRDIWKCMLSYAIVWNRFEV